MDAQVRLPVRFAGRISPGPDPAPAPEAGADSESSPAGISAHPHKCQYCEQFPVFVEEPMRPGYSISNGALRFSLGQVLQDHIEPAAAAGCPLFAWLWNKVKESKLPASQVPETSVVFELGIGDTTNKFKNIIDNLHTLTVMLEGDIHVWSPGAFELVSSYDDPSADHAIARCIVGDVSSTRSLLQVRERLSYCLQHHDACRLHGAAETGVRPLRLLDVGVAQVSCLSGILDDASYGPSNIKLVRSDLNDTWPYTTLSYVWGDDQSSKTTTATLAQNETRIAVSSLPKTIRDAIHVTRQIGVRFLWIDSLCIIQDSDEVAREVANMAAYYTNSILTISAAAAESCHEGFLRRLDPLEGTEDAELEFHLPLRSPQSPSGTVMLRAPRLSGREAIDHRAWTLQESLLATRLVSFSRDTICWSCCEATYGAINLGALRGRFQAVESQARLNVGAAPTMLIHSTVRNEPPDVSLETMQRAMMWTSKPVTPTGHLLALRVWDDIVSDYVERRLSNPEDSLRAISGIAREFSKVMMSSSDEHMPQYLAGHWWSSTKHLGLSLLWCVEPDPKQQGMVVGQPLDGPPAAQNTSSKIGEALDGQGETRKAGRWSWASLPRRTKQHGPSVGQPAGQASKYIAPSWSWASRQRPRMSLREGEGMSPGERGGNYFYDDKYGDGLYREVGYFRIMACRLELESSHALYGTVRSGYIDVQGWVLGGEPLQRYQGSFPILYDGPGQPDLATVTLLEIVSLQRRVGDDVNIEVIAAPSSTPDPAIAMTVPLPLTGDMWYI
ncbi:heterokaryon incompatibility protein-domain-containing protein [Podospora conica]|nr:heterokaryon incompatibility protein-domain-containing protein [Schizothecium conicum]